MIDPGASANALDISAEPPNQFAQLFDALGRTDTHTRVAAVRTLGEIGDTSAVPHLNRLLPGMSSERESTAALLGLPIALALSAFLHGADGLTIAAILAVTVPLAMLASVLLALQAIRKRRRSTRLMAAACDALARIAERSPDVDWRTQLPQLLEMQEDFLHQNEESRQAARRAVQAIRTTFERRSDLQQPSGAPATSRTALPVLVAELSPADSTLPLPMVHSA